MIKLAELGGWPRCDLPLGPSNLAFRDVVVSAVGTQRDNLGISEGLQREDTAGTFARTRESHIDGFTIRRGSYAVEARIVEVAAVSQ